MNTVQLYRESYARRQQFTTGSQICSLFVLVIALLTLSRMPDGFEGALFIAAFVLQALTLVFGSLAHHLAVSEYPLRVAAFKQEQLGQLAHVSKRAAVLAGGIGGVQQSVPYFASTEPPGTLRLLQCLAESAFFTLSLARIWRNALGLVLGSAILIALMIVFYLGLISDSSEITHSVTRSMIVLLGFIAFGQFAEQTLQTNILMRKTEGIFEDLVFLARTRPISTEDINDSLGMYAHTVSMSVPIPENLYGLKRNTLNAAWERARNEFS